MRPRVLFKIIASRRKQASSPSRRYFAGTMRLIETVHHLAQFLELLRPGCGLADHDQLGMQALSLSGTFARPALSSYCEAAPGQPPPREASPAQAGPARIEELITA